MGLFFGLLNLRAVLRIFGGDPADLLIRLSKSAFRAGSRLLR